ncbi:MAG TPA: Ig-like domain-containing protein [Candidatus Acidoferrum sp.]|nr:Ig-like domain-containing protein [Candidatus Acidoferrum sp.]
MHQFSFSLPPRLGALLAALILISASCLRMQAQAFIVSTVPANGASGVSPSAAVIFTFDQQMDTAVTGADFTDTMTFMPLPTTSTWSENDTVLTCTPSPAFPSSRMIVWIVEGESLIGDPLEDEAGFFTTSSTGGNTGSGTNRISAFGVGKLHSYDQSSAGAATLDDGIPYLFTATTTLASNRTANSVSVMLPTMAVSNLTQNFLHPESFFLFADHVDLASFNNTFPAGNYLFNVVAPTSNQQVTVNLPASLTQPNAPHIANFAAAQSVNATQSFQLSWDAFQGGTAADHISVSVGEAFRSPDFGAPGALNGTATAITIPAGTLQSNSNYNATVSFFQFTSSSNASYTTIAYIATTTDFSLVTSSGIATLPLVFTNAAWSGGAFAFDVLSSPGQLLTVEYSSTLLTNGWQPLLTTNSATGLARISHAATNQHLFYRAWKNP